MHYVGIDISKHKHDCFILSSLGEVINGRFSFTNDAAGFAKLLKQLSLTPKNEIRMGFEATGHYGLNLKLFLEKNGYSFMELNPLLISKFVKSRTRMVKRGSGILRYTIINCCCSMRLHNEVFAAYYLKKIAEGKSYRVVLTHMAKKLVRLIYALETNGVPFDSSKLR